MIKKSIYFIIIASIILIMFGCEKQAQRLDKSNGQTMPAAGDNTNNQSPETGIVGSIPAPAFLAGSYEMRVINSGENTVEWAQGGTYSDSQSQTYTYLMEISHTETGLSARFTFGRISWSVRQNGQIAASMDTAKTEERNEENGLYYDLIGQSFTAAVDNQGNVSSISGVSEIIAAYPSAYQLISEKSLLSVAAEIFYPIPGVIGNGTSWQWGSTLYTADRTRDDLIGFLVSGAGQTPPPPEYDAEYDTTMTTTDISSVQGVLWMNKNNRAVQEVSTAWKSSGTITGAEQAIFSSSTSYVRVIS